MNGVIIAGTSGVGKTFLEKLLVKEHNFFQFPKYTDRPYRPGEQDDPTIISLSTEEFENMENEGEFVSRIEQSGKLYGYKTSDQNVNSQPKALSVPIKDITAHAKVLTSFVPIVLYVSENHLDFLVERMKTRYEYVSQGSEKQSEIKQEIEKRLELTKSEFPMLEKVIQEVEGLGGKGFEIKDDNTVFEEVIPYIISKLK